MSQIGDHEETIEVVPNFLPVPDKVEVEEPTPVPQKVPEKVPAKT